MYSNDPQWIQTAIQDDGPFCTRAACAAVPFTFQCLRPRHLAEQLPSLPDTTDIALLLTIAQELQAIDARVYIVGGFVRDALMGIESKDIDVEIFGISSDALKSVLAQHGTVDCIGESFGVLLLHGVNIDWCLPRSDSKTGSGHRGFTVHCDPSLTREQAVRRRDLTMNAIMADPLTGEIFDPCGGLEDLRQGRLRAVDAELFGDDPLRGLRAVRFAAVYGFTPDAELLKLMSQQNLNELSSERLWGEWKIIALKSRLPSLAFKTLDDSGLIRYFPQMAALQETVQDPQWHPEGDVYTHTAMVCDRVVPLRNGGNSGDDGDGDDDGEHDLLLFFSALCHDLGKPATTEFLDGHWRSRAHEEAGVEPSIEFLSYIHSPLQLRKQVCALVREHLKPFSFFKNPAGASAYRRLARKLADDHVSLPILADLSEADYRGRTLSDVNDPEIEAVRFFREKCVEHKVSDQAPKPLVLGRHLISKGHKPGKELGALLEKCFDYQLETGETDIEIIMNTLVE